MPEGKSYFDTLSDRELLETIYQSQVVLSHKLNLLEHKTNILLRESKWFTQANPPLTGDHNLYPMEYDPDVDKSWYEDIYELKHSVDSIRQEMNEED